MSHTPKLKLISNVATYSVCDTDVKPDFSFCSEILVWKTCAELVENGSWKLDNQKTACSPNWLKADQIACKGISYSIFSMPLRQEKQIKMWGYIISVQLDRRRKYLFKNS